MSIFHVLSNVRHNGTSYEKGAFVDGDISEFGQLVAMGVLAEVDAASADEAAVVVALESEQKAVETATVEAAKPANTWGPARVEPENPETKQETPEIGSGDAEAPETTDVPLPAPGEVGAGDLPPTGDDL